MSCEPVKPLVKRTTTNRRGRRRPVGIDRLLTWINVGVDGPTRTTTSGS